MRDPLVQYSRGLNLAQIDMPILTPDGTCCFGKGRCSTEMPSKLFANHNALGQLTNHNTFRFSEGGPSSNPELIEPFVPGWGERYCNNVNYVKNNAIFEPPSMRACSSTPPKQNQDFVKEHNRTPLIFNIWHVCVLLRVPVCNKQSEHALWTCPEAHFLVTRSLNNKKNCAIYFRL